MGFKFMKVSNHLCGEADITVITTILVHIIMVTELFFRFKCLMAGFALKGFLEKLLTGILVFTGDSLTDRRSTYLFCLMFYSFHHTFLHSVTSQI